MEAAAALAPSRRTETEARAFARFVKLNAAESGEDGAPHYALSRVVDMTEVETQALARWSRRLDEPNWGRSWFLWASEPVVAANGEASSRVDKRIVGNVELRGGRVRAELHRATLGMGIARAFRGQGWGRKMLETVIDWAKNEASLSWIDLGVFVHNAPARALYEKMGFVPIGERSDAFRIDGFGEVIDIHMALDLRAR